MTPTEKSPTKAELNESGQLVKLIVLDADEKVKYYFVYEYNKDKLQTKYTKYDSSDKILEYTAYTYDENQHLIKDERFDAAGKLQSYHEYTVDKNGTRTSSREFDGSGKLVSEQNLQSAEPASSEHIFIRRGARCVSPFFVWRKKLTQTCGNHIMKVNNDGRRSLDGPGEADPARETPAARRHPDGGRLRLPVRQTLLQRR